MGYTHYWYRPRTIGKPIWGEIARDVTKVLAEVDKTKPLAGHDGTGSMSLGRDEIVFNGREPEDYETFCLTRVCATRCRDDHDGRHFDFCKTAKRPYDLAVMAVLVVLKHHLKDAAVVYTDGENADWHPAMFLCQELLGYGRELTITDRRYLEPFVQESTVQAKDDIQAARQS